MTKALIIVFLAITVALPSAAAEETAPEESSEPDEAGAQDAPGTEGEPEPSHPDGGDGDSDCSALGNGDMTENSLPVAPEADGFSGFVGIFVGTPSEDGGFTGQSFGVNTECVTSGVPDGLCVPEVTCLE